MSPTDCSRFDFCSANLCPLDAGLSERIWYSDEAICKSQKHGRHRWIRKQRSIQRRKTASWLEKQITYQMLFDASRKREVKPETIERLKSMRRRKQTQWREVLTPIQRGGNKPMHPFFWKDKIMRAIQVYYDATGPWGNWDDAIKGEMDRLKLTEAERKQVQSICLPESMRPRERKEKADAENDK